MRERARLARMHHPTGDDAADEYQLRRRRGRCWRSLPAADQGGEVVDHEGVIAIRPRLPSNGAMRVCHRPLALRARKYAMIAKLVNTMSARIATIATPAIQVNS